MNDEKYSLLKGNSGINNIFENNVTASSTGKRAGPVQVAQTPAALARPALLWPACTYYIRDRPVLSSAMVPVRRGMARRGRWIWLVT